MAAKQHAVNPTTSRARHLRMLLTCAVLLAMAAPAAGQSIDDGLMVQRRQLRLSVDYGHESWDRYWEGTLERSNDNIGTLTTQNVTWTGGYGITDRLTVIATLPYVWTSASRGVLHGMQGLQDVTFAIKYRLLRTPFTDAAMLSALATLGAGTPTSDYTPDFLPLSIGLASRRVLARAAIHVQHRAGWFVDGSVGHTWRAHVELDRPAYYTDGQLVLSNEVAMPDLSEYTVSVGYQNGRLHIPIGISGQRTLGGDDIRRQDMPFVSNRMNFTRLRAQVMYALPFPTGLAVQLGGLHTLTGRNVGQSTMFTGGFSYALHF
jgi:hypothetical protein